MSTATTARVTGTAATTMTLIVLDCPNCGVIFAITTDYEQRRRNDKQKLYCPNGHPMIYHESEADRLREDKQRLEQSLRMERDNAEFWRERDKASQASLRATKAAHTRTKNRIAKGVCPCCKRHFTNVERHIAGQHPEYVEEARDE